MCRSIMSKHITSKCKKANVFKHVEKQKYFANCPSFLRHTHAYMWSLNVQCNTEFNVKFQGHQNNHISEKEKIYLNLSSQHFSKIHTCVNSVNKVTQSSQSMEKKWKTVFHP